MKTREPPARFKHLLSPLAIGAVEIRNRVLVSAHEIKMAEKGLPTDQYIAYQAARARWRGAADNGGHSGAPHRRATGGWRPGQSG